MSSALIPYIHILYFNVYYVFTKTLEAQKMKLREDVTSFRSHSTLVGELGLEYPCFQISRPGRKTIEKDMNEST